MSLPDPDSAAADRIERALDGLLSEAELAALRADIVRDPSLRAAYVDRAWLDAALRAERECLPQLLAPAGTAAAGDEAAAAPAPVRAARWPLFASVATALAACIALAVTLARRPAATATASAAPAVAVLVQAQNTKWAGSTLPTVENSPLGPGSLALLEGIATVRFASGATVMLEAPTRLELVDPLHARLIEGSVTAEVPPAATGFTVETADLRVVDLGTRFGVTASTTGNSQVYVFEGSVRLDRPDGAEPRTLTAGKSYHVRSDAVSPGYIEPARLQPMGHIDGWTAIPTSFGRGKDAFARRGHTIAEPQPLLMVKHSELERSHTNERRAVLTFDLAAIEAATFAEAELVLDPEPSGMGFSAMVPDSRFALYGVTDEALDGWNESALAWDAAPIAAAGLAGAPLRRLAEFSLPRGASGAPFAVRSPDLADFLRADTNGLVTFLLVRETGETDPSGLVHAFASKEHPTARPPTLRVR